MRILIVEDEVIIAMDLKSKAERLGHEVIGINDNGLDAIKSCDEGRPDFVLMDINIEGDMDGIETARIVKEKFDVPVIFISAFSTDEIVKRTAAVDPYGYLIKPFDVKQLNSVLEISYNKYQYHKVLKNSREELKKLNDSLEEKVRERTEDLQNLNEELRSEIELRNAVEEALIESEERFRTIVENIAAGLIIVNESGLVVQVNPTALRILNFKSKELIGEHINKVFYQLDEWSDVRKNLNNASVEPVNLLLRDASGNSKWVKLTSTVLDNQKGVEFLISFIDIDLQKKNELLLEKERNNRLLSFFDGVEKERKRIAMDLHDGLGQNLTAAKLTIASALKEAEMKDNEKLTMAKEIIDSSIQEVRKITYDLVPNVLSDFGLKAAVEKMITQLDSSTTNFTIQFECENYESGFSTKEISLYRIIQEAVNNAVKYSEANQINVSLTNSGKAIYLLIQDNGKGFDVEKAISKKRGLFNISERCKLLNGKMLVESKRTGTNVKILINGED